jgi:hypothetical protein
MRQFYSVTKVTDRRRDGRSSRLATDLACPPCNIGPRSTPNYADLANAAIYSLPSGERVFAGQRDEGFFVDLGSVFDLADLRPFQNLHLIPTAAQPGVDGTKGFSVHSIAIQVPKTYLTRGGVNPTDPMNARSVVGVWAAASRQKVRVRDIGEEQRDQSSGPWVQVSRLANPLVNEVLIPLGKKDRWNASDPKDDGRFRQHYERPELQALLPVLYPGVFPNLAALNAPRADLVAILLTGIPAGIIPGFQNFTGPKPADQLRLNLAIPPTGSPKVRGLLAGDPAGFPNGRRVTDDVVAIELQAIAGATYPLVNATYTPDAAAAVVDDGLTTNESGFLPSFPYLAHPRPGYDHAHDP